MSVARGFAYVRDWMFCMDLLGSFCLVGIDKAERSGSYEFAIRDYCVSAEDFHVNDFSRFSSSPA